MAQSSAEATPNAPPSSTELPVKRPSVPQMEPAGGLGLATAVESGPQDEEVEEVEVVWEEVWEVDDE